MRGDLDDALARLRRWDEVRQRLAGSAGADDAGEVPSAPTPGPAFYEAVDAVGDVLRRHPETTVTITVREAERSWTTQVAWGIDGRPAVSPPVMSDAAVVDPLAGPLPGTVPGEAGPAALPPVSGNLGPAPRLGVASSLGNSAGSGSGPDLGAPSAPSVPGPAARAVAKSGLSAAFTRRPATEEDPPERTAARLADLIRRDPSLLDPPDEPLR